MKDTKNKNNPINPSLGPQPITLDQYREMLGDLCLKYVNLMREVDSLGCHNKRLLEELYEQKKYIEELEDQLAEYEGVSLDMF